MARVRGALLLSAAAVLSSCCCWKKPADPNSILAPANAYGEVPAGAKMVSNRKFLCRVADDKLQVLSPQAERQAELAQFQRDVETLAAIPEAQRSPDVRSILSAVAEGVDPLVEPTATATGADGKTVEHLLLSLAAGARAAVEAERLAVDRENSLAAYRLTYEAAPPSARRGLSAPDSLAGSALAAIEEARAKLGAALSLVPDLGEVRVEESGDPADAPASAADFEPVECGPPVAGDDGNAECDRAADGLYRRRWWPLKRFVTPIKDQAWRNLCWAFTAVDALESRELVMRGETRNLSEQFFTYRWKSTLVGPDGFVSTGESGHPEMALAALHSSPESVSEIPNEEFWRYNPACSRPRPPAPVTFAFDCKSYLGDCSATASQGPLFCTAAPGAGPGVGAVCAIRKFAVVAGGVPSTKTVQVWKSGQDLEVNSLRAVLANGQPIIAALDVLRGFERPTKGFVTDYEAVTAKGKKEAEAGSHTVLFVGFVTNDELAGVLPPEMYGFGGGYFVAKSSWGCGYGDGGYSYLPVAYVARFFNRLAVPEIPAERSTAWNTAKTFAAQAPKVQITLPFPSTDVALWPYRVNFVHDVDLAATANDAQDGAGCCADTFHWKLVAGPHLGKVGLVPASLLSGSKEARIEVTARDSDGNSGRATLWIADIEPRIAVISPLPEETFFTGERTFAAKITAEGVADGDPILSCSGLIWSTNPPLDAGDSGCTVSMAFTTAGDRAVNLDWTDGHHVAHVEVPIHVVEPTTSGPPKVTLGLATPPSLHGDAVVRFSFIDPGGPGQASLGYYQLVWELEHDDVVRQITPGPASGANEVRIPLPDELKGACGAAQEVLVRLSVTDHEWLTGSDTETFSYPLPPCIN